MNSGSRKQSVLALAPLVLLGGLAGAHGAERLTRVESAYPFPSPDGKTVVFQSNRLGPEPDIFRMDWDGANLTRLTDHPGADANPVYSADGSRIAFVSSRDGNEEIYVMNADGGGHARVTNSPGRDIHPYWSPDGERLIFNSNRESGTFELYTIRADGSGIARLTDNELHDTYASFSPDGTRIAFVRWMDDGDNPDLFIMNADGTGERRMTDHASFDGWPAWMPDGESIVFASDRVTERVWALYRLPLSGGMPSLIAVDADGRSRYTTPQPAAGGVIFFTGHLDGVGDLYRTELPRPSPADSPE